MEVKKVRNRKTPGTCSVDGCGRFAVAKTLGQLLCSSHRRRSEAGLALIGDIKAIGERGLGTVTPQGYRKLYKPNHPNAGTGGLIPEHRYVMSEHLGWPLFDNENIHHRNGVKLDNRIENLEIWVMSQPCGQRPEDLVAWAHEILDRYESNTRILGG